jgi:D-cysteine desulfhydrase
VLVPQPDSEHVRGQLDRIRASGATTHLTGGVKRAYALTPWLIARYASPPANLPYLLRPGGSVPLGCLGYVEAALELSHQVASGELPEPSHVVVALGSGGTAAGLLVGLKLAGLRSQLVCVLVNDLVKVDERTVARLARRTLRLIAKHGRDVGRVDVSPADVQVERDWLGSGYGYPTTAGDRATDLLTEELELEPVYTAKAMAALLELNRRGAFGPGPVLYWHTYGRPQERALASRPE